MSRAVTQNYLQAQLFTHCWGLDIRVHIYLPGLFTRDQNVAR